MAGVGVGGGGGVTLGVCGLVARARCLVGLSLFGRCESVWNESTRHLRACLWPCVFSHAVVCFVGGGNLTEEACSLAVSHGS